MNRLSFTVGQRINQFDNLPNQTVATFNELFPECPIKSFEDSAELEILKPMPNNSRLLNINGLQIVQ